MGKRGPAGKSIRQLKLEGTIRNDRHGKYLAPPGKLVELMPLPHLIDPEAPVDRQAIFQYFARELVEAGQSQSIDSVLLTQLVDAQVLYIECQKISRNDPAAMIGRKLASQIALLAGQEVRRLMTEFRLTPSTRQPVDWSSKPTATVDPIAVFLAKPAT